MNRQKRTEIYSRFRQRNPHPETELAYASPFELLVAVILSAQATDTGVNKATARLFPAARTPQAMLDLGAVISFSGLVFRTGEEASAVVARETAGDRLLIETDSPFLVAPGAPKGRNEPAYVRITGEWLARQRGDDPDALGDALVATYDRTFDRALQTS